MSENQQPQHEPTALHEFSFVPAPGESPAAFEAFIRYLNMKKRSLRTLAEEIDVHETTVKEWSSKFGWQKRLQDYNSYLLKACFQSSLSIHVGLEEMKAQCEKVIQATMARISVDFFNMGHATVKHQVRTNPEAVPIPVGIQLVNAGVRVANSREVPPDGQNAALEATQKRLEALADAYERDRSAAKALPPITETPASSDSTVN